MEVLNFKDFMKKNNLGSDTMNESELQRCDNYPYILEITKFILIKDS